MNITELKQTITKKFGDLQYDPEGHTYTLNGKELESTSSFIKQFIRPFEQYPIATAMGKSFNNKYPNLPPRDAKYYISRWRDISIAATTQGTKVHNYAENNYPHFIDEPDCDKERGCVEFFEKLDPRYVVVHMELRMYKEDILRSGTTDILIYDLVDKHFIIADWKTNEKDLFASYKGQKLLTPFEEYYANNYNKYSLQLSDYKNMFLYMFPEFKVKELWIIHLTTTKFKDRENYHRETIKPALKGKFFRMYKARDFSDELKQIYYERELEYNWYD